MIHSNATIHPKASLGVNVSVGAYSIIGEFSVIGDNSTIGNFCEIGLENGILPPSEVKIGANANIRSRSTIYQGSTFGEGLTTGHRVTIREGVVAGDGLQVGTLSDIQGHCRFGHHTRMHSNVFIAQGSVVGNCVWIFPYVVLTNDPHPPSETQIGVRVEDFAVIATMTTILPGVTVGRESLVAAMSMVRENVPEGAVFAGVPARQIARTDRIRLKSSGEPAYPWRRHFHRGYPKKLVESWILEFAK